MVGDKGINNPHGQLFGVDPKEEEVWPPVISSKANDFDHAQHGSDDLNITYTKIRIVGNDQTNVFVQVYPDDEVINFLRGKYLLPLPHPKPCGEQGGEMKAGWAADELGGAGDEVKGGYDLEDRKIAEVSEKAGLVHAPRFPFPRRKASWVALGTKQVRSSASIRWFLAPRAPRVGTYEFVLRVLSNAYVGFDHDESVDLTTKDASALPEYEIHPDDAELDDEPTLFEEMMNANIEADSDNDEEEDSDKDNDDESKEDGIHELTEEESKKRELQKAATAGDDSDSDSIALR